MHVNNNEIVLDETSMLVLETDAKGIIVYADETFVNYSEYSLDELIKGKIGSGLYFKLFSIF